MCVCCIIVYHAVLFSRFMFLYFTKKPPPRCRKIFFIFSDFYGKTRRRFDGGKCELGRFDLTRGRPGEDGGKASGRHREDLPSWDAAGDPMNRRRNWNRGEDQAGRVRSLPLSKLSALILPPPAILAAGPKTCRRSGPMTWNPPPMNRGRGSTGEGDRPPPVR